MQMTIKKPNTIERMVLEAAILSHDFLKAYGHIHRPDLLKIPFASWLLDTCLKHEKEFHSAPGIHAVKHAANISVKSNRLQDDHRKMLLDFLKNLPPSDHKFNISYLLKRTADYYGIEVYKKLRRQLEAAIDQEDVALCEQAITEMRKVRLMTGQCINPFSDKDRVIEAFEKDEKPLFKLTGAIGRMVNPQLKPGKFIGILARAKTGKTALMYNWSTIAKRYGNNVAVFACGDEDEDSSILRYGVILSGKNNEQEFCGTIAAPVMDCQHNQNGLCRLPQRPTRECIDLGEEEFYRLSPEELLDKIPKYLPCSKCRKKRGSNFKPAVWYEEQKIEHLDWRAAWKRFKSFNNVTRNPFKLFTYSSGTLSWPEIERVLDVLEDNEGWIPNVVFVDYFDLMKDTTGEKEFRHKENEKWKSGRRFSQDRNVLLIGATQSNMFGGVEKESLDGGNVNEDRRKLDHVTALFAINQTKDEKKKRIARFGPVVLRRGKFDIDYQCVLMQCLERGKLYTDSFLAWHEKKQKDR